MELLNRALGAITPAAQQRRFCRSQENRGKRRRLCTADAEPEPSGKRRQSTGDMIVVRYADDTIVGFELQHDAKRFLEDLSPRMTDFRAWPPSREEEAHRVRQAGDFRLPWVHALLPDPTKRQWLRAGKDASPHADVGEAEANQGTAQGDPPRRRRGARQMACPIASRPDGLLRRADERTGDHGVPSPSGRPLAPRHQAEGTEAPARIAANEGNRQSLPPVSAHPASVAGTTVSRQSSEAGARCGSTARRDLCGGRLAMAVPTATPRSPASMCHSVVVGERHNGEEPSAMQVITIGLLIHYSSMTIYFGERRGLSTP